MSRRRQVDLFEFLRLVTIALARKHLNRMQASVAILTALDSDGVTGTGVVVNADRTAVELGISASQVWRHLGTLDDWFEQTTKPTRGTKGKPGRRARYQLTDPCLDLGLSAVADGNEFPDRLAGSAGDTRHDSDADRVAWTGDETRHESTRNRVAEPTTEPRHESAESPESCRSSDPNRVALSAESCRIAERENATVPTSVGPTSVGPTSPVVPALPKPQDAREDNPEAERRRQLDELEALIASQDCGHRQVSADGVCRRCGTQAVAS